MKTMKNRNHNWAILEILAAAFLQSLQVGAADAVTDMRQTNAPASPLRRFDSGGTSGGWARPPAGLDSSLKNIAVHMGGNIRYELTVPKGATRRVALALCEGWWNETGKRVQVLRVEGAEPKTVDTDNFSTANIK